ncbi:MAG: FIST C-terminal domain-containing protein [Polyangiaceae bacterium]
MSASAESLIVSLQPSEKARGASPIKSFERVFATKLRAVRSPTSALVFISGANELAGDVAASVARLAPGARALVVPSRGVLSELAEIEGAAAASALIWSGPKPRVELGASALEGGEGGTRLLFPGSSIGAADLAAVRGASTIGGTAAGDTIWAVEEGRVVSASVAALVVSGQGAPVVEQSSSCRVIAPPLLVTRSSKRGAVQALRASEGARASEPAAIVQRTQEPSGASEILELDGAPALEMLSKTVGRVGQPGLIVFSVVPADAPERLLFRTIKGVDPSKKAILVDADIQAGDRLVLASRDATHARTDLAEAARRAEQRALGSAPRFALFVSCAARGRSLYREPDVDVKILKKRFPKLPIAGMHAGLQIIPWGPDDRSVALQQMSGVLGLFRAPS